MGIPNIEQGISKAEVKELDFFCRGRIASARDKRNSIIGGRKQYDPYKLNFLRPKLKMKARKITAEINDANFATRSPHFV